MKTDFGPETCSTRRCPHGKLYDDFCGQCDDRPDSDTPLTLKCWRNGKWQADELANLSAKLEREVAKLRIETAPPFGSGRRRNL
jgi:hypothetical protein